MVEKYFCRIFAQKRDIRRLAKKKHKVFFVLGSQHIPQQPICVKVLTGSMETLHSFRFYGQMGLNCVAALKKNRLTYVMSQNQTFRNYSGITKSSPPPAPATKEGIRWTTGREPIPPGHHPNDGFFVSFRFFVALLDRFCVQFDSSWGHVFGLCLKGYNEIHSR